MADIELVIKIPEKWFDDMVREKFTDIDELCAVIQHGTLLPKGHGRLIDADDIRVIELEDSLDFIRHEKGDGIDVYIDAPTIIEADKESEQKG